MTCNVFIGFVVICFVFLLIVFGAFASSAMILYTLVPNAFIFIYSKGSNKSRAKRPFSFICSVGKKKRTSRTRVAIIFMRGRRVFPNSFSFCGVTFITTGKPFLN